MPGDYLGPKTQFPLTQRLLSEVGVPRLSPDARTHLAERFNDALEGLVGRWLVDQMSDKELSTVIAADEGGSANARAELLRVVPNTQEVVRDSIGSLLGALRVAAAVAKEEGIIREDSPSGVA